MHSSNKILRNVIIFILIMLIILAGIMFWKEYQQYNNNVKNTNIVSNQNDSSMSSTLPPLSIDFSVNKELEEFLSHVVYFNARKNGRMTEMDVTTDEDFYEGVKLNIACELIANKMFNDGTDSEQARYEFKREEVNKAIKEFIDENVTEPIKSENSLLEYDSNKDAYVFKEAGDATTSGYIVKVLNQTNSNGIYKITVLYAYPSEGDIIDNNLDNYECYRTAIKLKVNEEYNYSKYQLFSTLPLESLEAGKIEDYK